MIRMQVIGYLGADAVQKEANGKAVLNFNIAHTERYKDGRGIQQEKTTWIECSLWGRENLAPYLKTGQQVFLDGSPTTNAFKTNSGDVASSFKLRVINIQLLGGKNREEEQAVNQEQPADDQPF